MFYSLISSNGEVAAVIERGEKDPPGEEDMLIVSTGDEVFGEGYAIGADGFVKSPGNSFRWDGAAWVESLEDQKRLLSEARAKAFISKGALLMELASMGIISVSDAEQAALGQIPDSFRDAIAAMPDETQSFARIRWAGSQTIHRDDPLIALAAYGRSITDEQLDAAFGVQISE